MRHAHVLLTTIALLLPATAALAAGDDFAGAFPDGVQRVWAGRDYWTNPLEDWRVSAGRLEVLSGGANRNVHVLTRQLGEKAGTLEMSVRIGRIDGEKGIASVGFRVGARSELGDYRSALFFGRGVHAGVTPDGGLFIGAPTGAKPIEAIAGAKVLTLRISARPDGDQYAVALTAADAAGKQLGSVTKRLAGDSLVGNLVLVNNFGSSRPARGARPPVAPMHWFDDWTISGTKVVACDAHAFGPILFAQYTLSRRVMKLTAQMPPIGAADSQTVDLQVKSGAAWKTLATEKIHPLARTATFRIPDWDDTADAPYRLAYTLKDTPKPVTHYWAGTIRRDPKDKKVLSVAGFTGNTDPAFPNALLAANVAKHDPDLLFFSGDQLYEGVGGFGIVRTPVDKAILTYLRKWYMWGWAFREVTRDRPTLTIPDDHDVYQGNVWGNGGNAITMAEHDAGGYAMHEDFVNVVHRTQTSHHPAPFDPTPIERGISVYHGDMVYGRISFAIIADRMFKSGPRGTVATWTGRADHIRDPKLDPKTVDKPGLKLLGSRQLKFLDHWAADWTGADMKTVLSQTIFCNLANYHGGGKMFLVADLDSNGWPQTGRNRALAAMRRGFAFHLAGDQHLPSIVLHGVDEYGDAGFSFCVPSTAAGYPRSWLPDKEGRPVKNRIEPGLPNTSDYLDGLGNRLTVYAIGNPAEKNRPGVLNTLHDKSSGYGMVRFDKSKREITIECWRLLFDAAAPKEGDQFPGWPRTISMLDNYGRKAHAHLPTIEVAGMDDPVVQIIDEADGSVVYTLRINGRSFRPKVFKDGAYTVKAGEPGEKKVKVFKGVKPAASGTLKVSF